MKLPWDRNYFKLSFYAIFTFIAIYIFKLVIDMCAYTIVNASGILNGISLTFGKIAGIFAPILIALCSAYVLHPFIMLIKRRIKNHRIACLIAFIIIVLPPFFVLGALLMRLKNAGGGSIAGGISVFLLECTKRIDIAYMYAMELLDRAGLGNIIKPYMERLFNEGKAFNLEGDAIKIIASSVFNIFLGLVMAFYLLISDNQAEKLGEALELLLPQALYNRLKVLAEDLDAIFSGYIRGQLTDGLIMAVLISLGLWLVKIPFAAVIGCISGFSNVVPYFGSIAGCLLTVLAAVMSGDYVRVLYGLGVMLVLQQIDSTIIVPKIVGTRVQISPFAVIAALTVGGKLFGLWGMVFAVPVAAVVKVFAERRLERRAKY